MLTTLVMTPAWTHEGGLARPTTQPVTGSRRRGPGGGPDLPPLMNLHGYRSRNFCRLPITLPSQPFGFDLLTDTMTRKALIVVFYGWEEWSVALPELRDHERVCCSRRRPRPAMRITDDNWSIPRPSKR